MLERIANPRAIQSYLALLLLCAGLEGFAQTQTLGTISGTITDTAGASVPGAKVTATNRGTGLGQTATTNDSGYFVFANLPAASYDVTAEKENFKRCSHTGVTLDPAGNVSLNCAMEVGEFTQTVEVHGQATGVSTEEAKVSRIVNQTQVQEVPVNGRNFVSLLGLQTGVVQEFAFNSNQSMNMFATEGTHVNGLRGDANNIQIEG